MNRPVRSGTLCGLALAAASIAAGSASAAPTAVTLRAEGVSSTIYEDQVITDGHNVTTASGGTHKCDGTNGGANPQPGPTPTAALDDAARRGGFTWDGTWNAGFDDYFVTRVGPDSQTASQFWGAFVNGEALQVGGCQYIVKGGDEVVWAFDAFNKARVLRLEGPRAIHVGDTATVAVKDVRNGAPVAGASVGGTTTGGDGQARIAFGQPGVYRLKADRADSVRSNALPVCVDPPEVEACVSSDRTAPQARMAVPRFATERARTTRFPLRWEGTDELGGSGIRSYTVETRRRDRRGAGWTTVVARTPATRMVFDGDPGADYAFRVRAVDRAGNQSLSPEAASAVPLDDRSPQVRRSRGWRLLERQWAFGRTVSRSKRRRAALALRFEGTGVAVIGRRLPRGGRLRITVDGRRARVKRMRGRPRFRTLIHVTGGLRPGRHRLRVSALGRRPVEIDALAVLP